jgi:hypothetical protein
MEIVITRQFTWGAKIMSLVLQSNSGSIHCTTADSSELCQIEDWLSILTKTYALHPNEALAKVIAYYLTRLIKHDDFSAFASQPCQYYSMLKYWQQQIA